MLPLSWPLHPICPLPTPPAGVVVDPHTRSQQLMLPSPLYRPKSDEARSGEEYHRRCRVAAATSLTTNATAPKSATAIQLPRKRQRADTPLSKPRRRPAHTRVSIVDRGVAGRHVSKHHRISQASRGPKRRLHKQNRLPASRHLHCATVTQSQKNTRLKRPIHASNDSDHATQRPNHR